MRTTNRRPTGTLERCVTSKPHGLTKYGIGDGSKPCRVGLTSPLDNAYMDAVDRAELAQDEVLEAERAVEREGPI